MNAKRITHWLPAVSLALILVACLTPLTVYAEPASVKLSVHRVKGADLLGRIAGVFRFVVQGPANVRSVTFYVDGLAVAHAANYPFAFQLDTANFPQGRHKIEAVVHFSDGGVTTSNSLSLEFRPNKWSLAVRQSMFLYAGLLVILGALGALGLRRLLHIQPRLVLLDDR